MQTIQVGLNSRSYPIYIGNGLIANADLVLPLLAQPHVAIITNEIVAPLYLDPLVRFFTKNGVRTHTLALPDGEANKDWSTLNRIFDFLLTNRCERKTTLIALGGGVIGDLTGFAAATYLRGVPFIQIPTTLLAQVDSSVGGKTGINHPLGKNMIGAFYQPKLVLTDTDTLRTLPDKEISAGLAEIIKYGLIRDLPFFVWLEENISLLRQRDAAALAYAISQSCQNKAEVVMADEREGGVRALLNLGHTFGHAIEAGLGFGTWLHGEAVAAGTILAATVSLRMKLISEQDLARIKDIYQKAGLPIKAPNLGKDKYLELMGSDKKVEGGKMRFILLKNIGAAFVSSEVPQQLLVDLLSAP